MNKQIDPDVDFPKETLDKGALPDDEADDEEIYKFPRGWLDEDVALEREKERDHEKEREVPREPDYLPNY